MEDRPVTATARKNGYRGEPSHKETYIALLPGQRLCLALTDDGKRCVQPRRHKGKCKP